MEELAGKVGVEPTLAESESAVLPLDDFPSVIDARADRACVGTPKEIRTPVLALKGRRPDRARRFGANNIVWRRVKDSNPRGTHRPCGLANRRLEPLGYLSES